jgi:cold shock CspA family protein/ribosome-associated translation inhibitor RaiA
MAEDEKPVMQTPLVIAFEGIGHSDAIEARIREEASKLEQFHERITSARVVVARTQHRHHHGDTFRIRIHVQAPGGVDIHVNRDPSVTGRHEDIQVTITDAFDAARRQLQDAIRKQKGYTKSHETPPHGTIQMLLPDKDCGFITAADGREIYFHRNSVADGGFDELSVGEEVRFSEEAGDQGPRATIVQPVGKHHLD